MSRFRILSLASLMLLACVASASAAVQIRVGVRPDTLRHCDSGHFALALWNDDATTLRVRVSVSIVFDDSVVTGPRQLRTRLGPNELRKREFDFTVPEALPIGRYALRMAAVASDSSRSVSVARFVVVRSACTIDGGPPTVMVSFLDAVAAATGLDFATPTVQASWGGLKRRYDDTPR